MLRPEWIGRHPSLGGVGPDPPTDATEPDSATVLSMVKAAYRTWRRPTARFWRLVLAFGVLAISAFAAVNAYAGVIAAGGNDHQAGDWLISYPGTFVRRGLFGELLFADAPAGQTTLWILFAVQLALYLPLFAYTIDYLNRSNFSWSSIALACSPAALPFIGWDPLGGFRKESIGFLALVLLAFARRADRRGIRAALLMGSLLAWTLGVFSWESLAFLLPAVGFLLLADDVLDYRRALAGIYAAIGAVALGVSVVFHGDAGTPGALCQVVVDHGLNPDRLCTGAIAWMGRTTDDSLRLVQQNLAVHSGYLVMLALAVLPIVVSPWLRRYWPWLVACAIGVAPLFALGIDYGRWIHILIIEVTICMMASHPKLSESPLWNPLSVGLFVSLWGIPHAAPTPANLAGWPFKGLLDTVIVWMQSTLMPWL